MSNLGNLRPQYLPTWPIAVVLGALAFTAPMLREHFQLRGNWFGIPAYILMIFVVVVLAFRPAWGRAAFWTIAGVLFLLHSSSGLLLMIYFPSLIDALAKIAGLIIVLDLFLTAAVIWRWTVSREERHMPYVKPR